MDEQILKPPFHEYCKAVIVVPAGELCFNDCACEEYFIKEHKEKVAEAIKKNQCPYGCVRCEVLKSVKDELGL